MNFHDKTHHFATLSIHTVIDLSIEEMFKPEVSGALIAWKQRTNVNDAGVEHLQLPNALGFFIDYQGNSRLHWPDEKANLIGESLIREYLYKDGICQVTSEDIRAVKITYSFMAGETGDEYLLTCPIMTASSNIAGLTVVCLNKYLLH